MLICRCTIGSIGLASVPCLRLIVLSLMSLFVARLPLTAALICIFRRGLITLRWISLMPLLLLQALRAARISFECLRLCVPGYCGWGVCLQASYLLQIITCFLHTQLYNVPDVTHELLVFALCPKSVSSSLSHRTIMDFPQLVVTYPLDHSCALRRASIFER